MVASLSRVSSPRSTEIRFPGTQSPLPTQQILIGLIGDELPLRQGLRNLLKFYSSNGSRQFNVVGRASSREQAIYLAQTQKPDLILLDIELSEDIGAGLNTLKLLRESYAGKVLVLSSQQEDNLIFQVMQAGANGFLLKDKLASQLSAAMTRVLSDQVYLDLDVATRFFRFFQLHTQQNSSNCSVQLSDRELQVLKRLVEGNPNAEIATTLHITVATVKAHLTSIFEKLGVKSRSQAIVTALRLGLV